MKGYEIRDDQTKLQQEITTYHLPLGERNSLRKDKEAEEMGDKPGAKSTPVGLRTNLLHKISFLESYTSSGICLMRLAPERCIEHVRHSVPMRAEGQITSHTLTTHLLFQPASLSVGSLGNNK